MRATHVTASLFFVVIASSAIAHGPHHGGGAMGAMRQNPYSEMLQRAIKALSDQEIAELRAGRGMGLALAAELNGYPGPLHTLDHADQLKLSPDQRAKIAAAFAAMKRETSTIGEEVIVAEADLNKMFADRSVTSGRLDEAVMRIATLRGRLRGAPSLPFADGKHPDGGAGRHLCPCARLCARSEGELIEARGHPRAGDTTVARGRYSQDRVRASGLVVLCGSPAIVQTQAQA